MYFTDEHVPVDVEKALSGYLDKNLERMFLNYMKGVDFSSMVKQFLMRNQEQVLKQLVKEIGVGITGSTGLDNMDKNFNNSQNQTLGNLAGALNNAFSRYF